MFTFPTLVENSRVIACPYFEIRNIFKISGVSSELYKLTCLALKKVKISKLTKINFIKSIHLKTPFEKKMGKY